MSLGFRNVDSRYSFFWETADQPEARWHAQGTGPVQYLADTPDGAWAEFLRHEEITEPEDLAGIERSLWTIELPENIEDSEPVLIGDARGGRDSYPACQTYAASRRAAGITMLRAPSAALADGAARGQVSDGGLRDGPARDGHVWVLFGPFPELCGWCVVEQGRPAARLLPLVIPLG